MFKNILVAVDGSKYANAAFKAAVDMAQKYGSRLTVLHVFFGSTGRSTLVSGVNEDENRSAAQEIIKSYAKELENKDLRKARVLLKKGDAAQRIIETAKSEAADLVVMGNRGRGGFKGLLLGSVSNKVASHVRCPVMIMK
jgi:nucleotide-binding universal stress UspA family protein